MRKIFIIGALLYAQLAFGQSDTTKPLFSHQDMWLFKRVGNPVPSPDGRLIVFSLTDPSYDEKEQRSDLWIVATDGKAKPRQITNSLAGEGGIAWSPDGRKIAFTAKREGDVVSLVYILNLAEGGEAMRLTNLSTGAGSPQWRPDGKAILFTSSVYPGGDNDSLNKKIAADRKARKYKARVYEGFPIRNWDKWLDDTKTHYFVQSLDEGSKAKDLMAGTKMSNEPGYAGGGAIWSPDGKSIVFSATTKRNTAAFAEVNFHLWRLPVEGGEPVQLTPDNGSYGNPTFSPDGKTLYASHSPANQWVYNDTRLVKLGWPNAGVPVVLTESFGRSVGSYVISPDGKSIYLLAEDAGHENLYMLPSSGGSVKPVIILNSGVYSGLAVAERASSIMLFGKWESTARPSEIIAFDLKNKSHRFLTEFNTAKANQLNLPTLRKFWHTTKEGHKVHNMLAVPPGFDPTKKYPLITMIHGGPHSMWNDNFHLRWNVFLLASPGYVILMTDYRGSVGYGEKFAQLIQGDPFAGPAADLHGGIDKAIEMFDFIDTTRMAAMGASYGGHMANWLQGTTTRFKCLISHAGLINLESQWGTSDVIYHREVNNGGPVWEQGEVWRTQNPARLAANFKTPVLVTIGENDFRVPLNQSIEYWSFLQRLQVPSRLVVFPDENHWIMKGENSKFFYSEVHDWLAKYLKN